ncbi:hypothetical protein HC928_10390 [bacterium]|nr:hypothetical protein [bacterium]
MDIDKTSLARPTDHDKGCTLEMSIIVRYGGIDVGVLYPDKNIQEELQNYRELSEREGIMLELIHGNGNNLVVGISDLGCCLTFVQASGDPPYYTSRSSSDYVNLQGSSEVVFQSGPMDFNEMSVNTLVTFSDLVRVVQSFVVTGIIPKDVIFWQID